MFERLGNRLGLNAIPQIFVTAAAIAIVFVAFAIPFHEPFAYAFGLVGSFTFQYFGWFYVASVSGLLIFLIWIAFSKYGGIRLGADEETPQYSTETWFAMLFAAGIGTILMFWGVAEPLSHFANPPMAGATNGGRCQTCHECGALPFRPAHLDNLHTPSVGDCLLQLSQESANAHQQCVLSGAG